jgi:hypothetical protein
MASAKRASPRIGVVLAFVVLGACGYDWTVVAREKADKEADGGSLTTSKPGTTPGEGCRSSKECDSTELCVFDDQVCGEGEPGTCALRPPAAKCEGAAPAPVCGCDGEIHDSRCAASAAGTDVAAKGSCSLPANTFRCGWAVCSTKTFCVETHPSKTNGAAGEYRCAPWTCATKACDCKDVALACTGGVCEVGPDGEVLVDCTP